MTTMLTSYVSLSFLSIFTGARRKDGLGSTKRSTIKARTNRTGTTRLRTRSRMTRPTRQRARRTDDAGGRGAASLECQGGVARGIQVLPPGRGPQRAGVPPRSRWPSAGDLGGDGRVRSGAGRCATWCARNKCCVIVIILI